MKFVLSRPDYRPLVAGLDVKVPLQSGISIPSINFDNAATTPPFNSVLEQIMSFSRLYSSVHRGTGYKSILTSEFYENARLQILKFVKGNSHHDTVIFVKNTTEAINKLAFRLCEKNRECVIISTAMEHHSNDLPWRNKYHVVYAEVDDKGRLILEDLEKKLIQFKGKVKLVTVTGASNVTGYLNPVHKIAELAHRYKAQILVDGAQLIPHVAFDMKDPGHPMHIDFLAFSAHKLYAPFGTGVLIGPKETFKKGAPDYSGGGTVRTVTQDWIYWDDPPHKDEAGSPNIMGVVALTTAIQTLEQIGLKNIEHHERSLTDYALKRLKRIPELILYGELTTQLKIGVVPFNLRDLHHENVARILSAEGGIAVRSGCFCAQPYIQRLLHLTSQDMQQYLHNPNLPRPGMVRLSFGIYNTYEEIDQLVNLLTKISANRISYARIYASTAPNYVRD